MTTQNAGASKIDVFLKREVDYEARLNPENGSCLLYTSDAADERSSVDLGGRRLIKKKNSKNIDGCYPVNQKCYAQKDTADSRTKTK